MPKLVLDVSINIQLMTSADEVAVITAADGIDPINLYNEKNLNSNALAFVRRCLIGYCQNFVTVHVYPAIYCQK